MKASFINVKLPRGITTQATTFIEITNINFIIFIG
jgi:hypothetical protein